MTAQVRDWLDGGPNNGLGLTSEEGSWRFDGKENRLTAHEPVLHVTALPVPGPRGAQGPAGTVGEAGPAGTAPPGPASSIRVNRPFA